MILALKLTSQQLITISASEYYFSESQARYIVTITPENELAFKNLAKHLISLLKK